MNDFDSDCPKKLILLRNLNNNRKTGLFGTMKWKTLYEISQLLGTDGRTKQIIKEFVFSGLLKKDLEGYYLDIKMVKKVYANSIYSQLGKEIGLGDIFG